MRSLSPALYTLAVSMKLMPPSTAASTMRTESSSDVGPPKFMAPRQIGETWTPVRPKSRYVTEGSLCSYLRGSSRQAVGGAPTLESLHLDATESSGDAPVL